MVSLLASGALSLSLPLQVFLAEMCVVTLGTMRIIFISRGRKALAPCLGFFEIIIWLFAIGQIMKNLDSLACHAAFASGFTLGNFLGVLLEKRLAIGTVVVRVITHRNAEALVQRLREEDFGVTVLNGEGASGAVKVILTVVPRNQLVHVVDLIKEIDPGLFYSVDEIQSSAAGIFPHARPRHRVLAQVLPRVLRPAA